MNFLEQINIHKLIFAASLSLLGFTGYRLTTSLMEKPEVPRSPTKEGVELHKADDQLAQRIEPKDFGLFWNFGERNPFQLPKPTIAANGFFVISERGGSPVITGLYMCTADNPADRIAVERPRGWSLRSTDGLETRWKGAGAKTITQELLFKEIQFGRFNIGLEGHLRDRGEKTYEFSGISVVDATDTGYIGIKSTNNYEIIVKGTESLVPVSQKPRQLKNPDQAFRYTQPYKLIFALKEKPKQVTKVNQPPPPPPDPGTTEDDNNPGPVEPVEPPPKEKPYEVPVKFNAMIETDKTYVVFEEKETGELIRRYVGQTVDGLKVVEINPTSVLLEDEKGNYYRLLDESRKKYD